MPPVRRHIRLSRHTVLECRIYLDPPGNPNSWLLREPDAALPRIIADIKELVLQRVREERITAHSKPKKNKEIKDTVTGDDYMVSVFFTPIAANYSLVLKNRQIQAKPEQSTARAGNNDDAKAIVLVEDETEEPEQLQDIPDVHEDEDDDVVMQGTRPDPRTGGLDDKKKIGTQTTYDGLNVFEKALVLIVQRTGAGAAARSNAAKVMEDWIVSTQVAKDPEQLE